MQQANLTIGRLAKAAGVGIETIRYYQKIHLLPIPECKDSAFRYYPTTVIDRIRFIKRAQELGFSLDEIAELLQLEDGTHRKQIREIASARLQQIQSKIADLNRMKRTLNHLIHECEIKNQAQSCPIISALTNNKITG